MMIMIILYKIYNATEIQKSGETTKEKTKARLSKEEEIRPENPSR